MIVALRRVATQHQRTTHFDAAGHADHPLPRPTRSVSDWDRISYCNDVDEVLDPDEVCGVAGVQAGSMGVRCRRDQQVRH